MSTPMPGHHAPGAGFEAPLEMLAACHHRIERQCTTLQRLVPHLGRHGADADAREAAAAVLRYFDTAARDHHADEEADLFPALQAAAGTDAPGVAALLASLLAEHRALEQVWQRLRPALLQVAAGGAAALEATAVDALVDAYARHTAREDAALLPLAARLLDDAALAQVGRAMRERRGIAPVV